jgi:hypothetical protein
MNDIAELTIKINSIEAELARRRLDSLEKQSKETAGSAALLEHAYAKLMRVLGPAALAGAFALAVRSAINLQDQYVRLSEIAGTTATRMAAFDLASRKSGTSMEAVAQSIARLGKAIGDARLGDAQQGGLLRALGIDPNDGRDAAEIFVDVSRAIMSMKDQNIAAVASQQLLSRGFSEMRPIMKEVVEMGKLQSRQTEEQIQAAKEAADQIAELSFEFDQMKIRLTNTLLPVLKEMVQILIDLAKEGDAANLAFQGGIVVFQTIAVLAANVVYVFKTVGMEIGVIAAQLSALADVPSLPKLAKLLGEDLVMGTKKFDEAISGFNRAGLIRDQWKKDSEKMRQDLDDFEKRVMSLGKTSSTVRVAPGGAMDMGQGTGFMLQGKQQGESEAERRAREFLAFQRTYDQRVQAEKDFAQKYADAITVGNELAKEAHKQGLLGDEALIKQLADNEDARLQVMIQSLEKQKALHERKGDDAKAQEAAGQAEAILAVATATAEGLRRVGDALSGRGGMEAMQLRVAEEYVKQFGRLADEASSTLIVPANLSDISSMIAMATSVVKQQVAKAG